MTEDQELLHYAYALYSHLDSLLFQLVALKPSLDVLPKSDCFTDLYLQISLLKTLFRSDDSLQPDVKVLAQSDQQTLKTSIYTTLLLHGGPKIAPFLQLSSEELRSVKKNRAWIDKSKDMNWDDYVKENYKYKTAINACFFAMKFADQCLIGSPDLVQKFHQDILRHKNKLN